MCTRSHSTLRLCPSRSLGGAERRQRAEWVARDQTRCPAPAMRLRVTAKNSFLQRSGYWERQVSREGIGRDPAASHNQLKASGFWH